MTIRNELKEFDAHDDEMMKVREVAECVVALGLNLNKKNEME